MCIVAIALNKSRRYPVMLAANRDERHERASAPADWWPDAPGVVGGRDLVAGGTWLGVNTRGRVAAVTNIYEVRTNTAPRSRGELVAGFLTDTRAATDYVTDVKARCADYGPFNLILSDDGRLCALSNRNDGVTLEPGVHVYSNNLPGQDWPKLARIESGLMALADSTDPAAALFELLAERDGSGAPRDSIFVLGKDFGTRCSTVVLIDDRNVVRFVERRFDPDGQPSGSSEIEFTCTK